MSLFNDLRYAWRFGDEYGVAEPLKDLVAGAVITPAGSGSFPSGHQAAAQIAPLSGSLFARNYMTSGGASVRGWGEASVSISLPLTLAVWVTRNTDGSDPIGWNVARLTHSSAPNDSPLPLLRIAPLANLRRIELSARRDDGVTVSIVESEAITGGSENPQLLVLRLESTTFKLDVAGHRYSQSVELMSGPLDTLILGPKQVATEDVPSQTYGGQLGQEFLSECYIWDRALSDEEVDSLYVLDGSAPDVSALYPWGFAAVSPEAATLEPAASEPLLHAAITTTATITPAASVLLLNAVIPTAATIEPAAAHPCVSSLIPTAATIEPAASDPVVNAVISESSSIEPTASEPLLTWVIADAATIEPAASDVLVNAVIPTAATLEPAATAAVVGAVTMPRADTVLLTEACESGVLADWTALDAADAVQAAVGHSGSGIVVTHDGIGNAVGGGFVAPVQASHLRFEAQWLAASQPMYGVDRRWLSLANDNGDEIVRIIRDPSSNGLRIVEWDGAAWQSRGMFGVAWDDNLFPVWHAVVLVWNGSSGDITIKLDGTEIATAAVDAIGEMAIVLGTSANDGNGYGHNGWDEIAITALAVPEVEATASEPTLDAPSDALIATPATIEPAASAVLVNALIEDAATITASASEPSQVMPSTISDAATIEPAASAVLVNAIIDVAASFTAAGSEPTLNAVIMSPASVTPAASEPTVTEIAVATISSVARITFTVSRPRLSTFPRAIKRGQAVIAGGGQ